MFSASLRIALVEENSILVGTNTHLVFAVRLIRLGSALYQLEGGLLLYNNYYQLTVGQGAEQKAAVAPI